MRFEGKPQCHIIPIAKERAEIALSVGCMLSRVRTGMSNNEVTCAIPLIRVSTLIEKLRTVRAADDATQSEAYSGPITLSQYERFQSIREQMAREGVNIPLPTGN